jgi:hypothetical protein
MCLENVQHGGSHFVLISVYLIGLMCHVTLDDLAFHWVICRTPSRALVKLKLLIGLY